MYLLRMPENDQTGAAVSAPEAGTTFQIAYKGRGVVNGTMESKELAIALSGISDLMERSNLLLNGDNSVVNLRVLSDFESGSFDINFLLDHNLRDAAAALLPALGAMSAPQILDTVFGTYEKAKGILSGAAKVYKALRGEKPKETRDGAETNTKILVFGNNNTIITDVNTARLYNDDRVREALSKTADPLLRPGYESLSVNRDGREIETLESVDIPAISISEVGSTTSEGKASPTRELWVRVVKPNFDGGRWTFHDGSAKFGADVEDKAFQARVNSREQGFFNGDRFLIRLRSSQHIDKNGGLITTNVVENVLNYVEAPKQHSLTDGSDPN
jgi:hypothetical protein